LLITVEKAKSQNTCSSAIVFNNSNIDSTLLYSNTGKDYWIKFTANYSNYVFELSQPGQTPFAGLRYFQLYSGNCNSLELISVDSANFTAINLIYGTDYYLVINKIDSSYSYFNLTVHIDTNDYSEYREWDETRCPLSNCELVRNPGFNSMFTHPDNISPFTYNQETGQVCGWLSLAISPNLYEDPLIPGDFYAKMWSQPSGNIVYGEAIRQTLLTPLNTNADYIFEFDWQTASGINVLDEFNVYLVNPNVINTTPAYYDILGLHNNNNTGLRDILENAVIGNINGIKLGANTFLNLLNNNNMTHVSLPFHCPNSDFTMLILFPYDDDVNGVTIWLDNVKITSTYTPHISGNQNNCDQNSVYNVNDPQNGTIYTWTISDPAYAATSFPQYGSSLNVEWNPLYNLGGATSEYYYLYVEAHDTASDCYHTDSLKIWKCCKKNDQSPAFNDTIIDNPSIFYVVPVPVFNGTIIINQNITVTNAANILMGPEARIIVNPPYTFTVTQSNILAGCNYMWDGIYVTDSNAKVKIQTNSTIKDALNAIYSENGGKFELISSKFYNNYTSVSVKNNYWGPYMFPFTGYPHKGIVKGCTFAQSGTGLINPYSGQKPRYGFYLDNVDRITIGDSTVAGNTNTFRSLFCGVYSKNSTIKLVNNDFRRIKPATYCQYQYPEVFTTQYCETAIFSIYYNPDGLLLNGSSLTCGGNSTTTRNTFDTCNMAIYTYFTTSKLTKNKIYNTNTGIKVRDVRAGSYISHSLMKTNTPVGIQVINTVPTLTRVTVMYDTILDPSNGIYLSNITSHATIALLKSVVRNNYVTLNKTGFIYGLRLENSNYINAYCNKVKRSTLVPVADSLKQIGIQLEHCSSAYIHDNSFSKLSLGIKCSGNLSNAKLKMNNIDSCYHGFYFATAYSGNGTVLTDQGTAYWPFDNKFSEYPGKPIEYRYGGALPGAISINWWYKYPPLYYKISIPSGHPLNPKIVPQLTTGNDTAINCGSQPQGLMGSGTSGSGISNSSGSSTDAQALDIAFNESYSFGEINEPMKYILQDNAYNILSNMEQQPTPANSALMQQYNTIYSQLTSGNIGKFSRVLSLIDAGQIADAGSVNAGIVPTNTIESNKQFAYRVYFNYVLPQIEIPAAEVEQLQLIADTPPCIGGGGVFVARAILGYTEPFISENKSLTQQSSDDDTEGTVVVYPNPTDDEVNILLDGYQSGQQIYAGLYSLVGTPVLEKLLTCGYETVSISLGNLPAGCYIFVLKIKDKTIYNNRLVIIR